MLAIKVLEHRMSLKYRTLYLAADGGRMTGCQSSIKRKDKENDDEIDGFLL